MTTVLDQITKAQESTFDLLVDSNENLVSLTRSANKRAQQLQKRINKRITKAAPSRKDLAPQKLADSYFDFASKSLELNRQLVGSVIEAWAPARKTPARKAPVKKAPVQKAPAKKASAKK